MTVARGGRLPDAPDAAMEQLNTSVHFDKVLWRDDIEGSRAHIGGLLAVGVLTAAEAETLRAGLDRIAGEIERDEFDWDRSKEDVHMNIEARLIAICGDVGGKLHTGRSRNDQVATDLRLWCRREAGEVMSEIEALARVILEVAAANVDVLMPSYTHLQRAQPSRLAHHLLAWEAMLQRDHSRLADAARRLNECPLGSGAVAGSGFSVDREAMAAELGFDRAMGNSLDATASRDFAAELACALAILCVHMSRVGEEIVIWSTSEFGFMSLSDLFATSSSMMPQKKNPDVAELIRGKAARAIGDAAGLLSLEKSLGFGYGRDMQEDKEQLFDAFECARLSLPALRGAIGTATFHGERMRAALDRGHVCATDLADYLVRQGVPFRQAHHVVGGLVREAETRELQLGELPSDVLKAAHPTLEGPQMRAALDPARAVEGRDVIGGPARRRVVEAIAASRSHWDDFSTSDD